MLVDAVSETSLLDGRAGGGLARDWYATSAAAIEACDEHRVRRHRRRVVVASEHRVETARSQAAEQPEASECPSELPATVGEPVGGVRAEEHGEPPERRVPRAIGPLAVEVSEGGREEQGRERRRVAHRDDRVKVLAILLRDAAAEEAAMVREAADAALANGAMVHIAIALVAFTNAHDDGRDRCHGGPPC